MLQFMFHPGISRIFIGRPNFYNGWGPSSSARGSPALGPGCGGVKGLLFGVRTTEAGLFDLVRSQVRDAAGQGPVMSERLFNFSASISPECVFQGHDHLGAGLDRAVPERIDIFNVKINGDGRALEALDPSAPYL